MEIVQEIDVSELHHKAIEALRNQAFPDSQVSRSYFKQLPHMRALHFQGEQLVGYLGLDYRAVSVGGEIHKVLGVIDFCVDERYRGQGIGSFMLSEVSAFAETKDVDFIILISDLDDFYSLNGFNKVQCMQSWLRLHEHTNFGVAVEHVDELYVKPLRDKQWGVGHFDWLGYMY
ncbi:GNAT family N-acetyltransferase [Vibrio parahaemolyticus]|uniref:GNAT family N-acetyltransferase n=1 Tax=Vibrio parahaemolyticus TaxID=670 RepID=UPI0009471A59|nr:GNAT family N-acetyltransferase [Vibrio parahaemolyticus]MBE3844568.1 GNAT family N-acetyltransferase [Vibrio parahaemolyticus]MBE3945617.1 GNAT family N-acetyltransferase [Vibrio parahaemolyticus]MBE4120721.1 GNAT family N-acetyltransferase [Vibrio parahaemolyticus]MBE4781406.1 GNAT family N-acetyltransferase [Vibrio parahaemolyticus]MEA5290534.1 GNAT family N-acetyltransferase [Vibrio parahaemolyticus]